MLILPLAGLLLFLGPSPQYTPTGPHNTVATGGGGGTFTFVQKTLGVDISSSGSSVAISSTTSGNGLFAAFNLRSSSSDTITSITGACTSTWARGSRSTQSTANRAQEIWYCTSASASATSITVNYTTSGGTVTVVEAEVHSTASIIFSGGAGTTNGTAANPYTGPSFTGVGGAVLTYYTSSSTVCSASTPPPTWSTTFGENHGNPLWMSVNNASGTYALTCTGAGVGDDVNNGIMALQ